VNGAGPAGLALAAVLADCDLCPRHCHVDRTTASSGGFCRLGPDALVYKSLLSLGEEAPLRPTWLVDLGGCSLRCVFCSEWSHVVDPAHGTTVPVTADWLRSELARQRAAGATSVSCVGGDPTVSAVGWLAAWHTIPVAERLPLVWNCNGLLTNQSLDLLLPEVACWVLDAKTFEPACTQRILGGFGQQYLTELAATLQVLRALPEQGPLPRLIVRHLLLPGHLECCTAPLLAWLAPRLGQTPLNLMTIYVPTGPTILPHSRSAELQRWNNRQDKEQALALARTLLPVVWLDGNPLQ
jgi:putative pyruvate formate lyase activating enzyme